MDVFHYRSLILAALSVLFHLAQGNFVELLRLSNSSTIGLFDLWYLGNNISCGSTSEDFFRSDLIDRMQLDKPCPNLLYLVFATRDNPSFSTLKFNHQSPSIEGILLSDSVDETPTSFNPTDHMSQVQTDDGFEYKFTDATGRYLYAGILHPVNGSELRYFLDFAGYDLNNGLPTTTNIASVSIFGGYPSSSPECTDTTTEVQPDFPLCETPPTIVPEFTMYDVVYGDNVTLKCTVTSSQFTIIEALWENLVQGEVSFNASNLPGDMLLNIENVNFGHVGHYGCVVENQLHVHSWGDIHLNVTGALPQVTISQSAITKNVTETVTLHCSVVAVPTATNVYWRKRVNGVDTTVSTANSRFTIAAMPTPDLTITNLQQGEGGEYFCVAANLLGENTSGGITLRVNAVTTEDLCPCSCEYRAKIDYWASHNVTNMTYDEIVEWLQPKIKELEKALTVDKANISAILNKKISAKDNRPSARNIGVLGIVILACVALMIILSDVSSISRHVQTIKVLWGKKE